VWAGKAAKLDFSSLVILVRVDVHGVRLVLFNFSRLFKEKKNEGDRDEESVDVFNSTRLDKYSTHAPRYRSNFK